MRRFRVLSTVAWTLAFLVAIDLAIGLFLAVPKDNRRPASRLQRYFDYGRSVEGKLQRMVGSTDADAAPIVNAGWLERDCVQPIPSPSNQRLGVSIYGMSFSEHIAQQLPRIDPSVEAFSHFGPSASVNHSYACFRMLHDAGRDTNPVQIIGVLASSNDRMLTLTGLTTSFEAPMPFTYPRYRLRNDGGLEAEQPIVRRPEQLREPSTLRSFVAQLARSDRFFDHFLFESGLADHSTFLRLLRRAYAQHRGASRSSEWVAQAATSSLDAETGPLISALLKDFAIRVRAEHRIPIVILFQDRPGIDRLYRLLGPDLERDGIPFVSTHDIVPTSNPANFLGDSHFTAIGDRHVAEKVLALIRAQLAARDSTISASAPAIPRADR